MADRRLSPGENIEQWNLKKGKEDISVNKDCSDPYRMVFEKKENRCWSFGKTPTPPQKEAIAKEWR